MQSAKGIGMMRYEVWRYKGDSTRRETVAAFKSSKAARAATELLNFGAKQYLYVWVGPVRV